MHPVISIGKQFWEISGMSKKKQRTVGFAFTGSFCTYEKIKEVVRQLVKEDNRVIPIFSQTAQTVNCRFGDARDFIIEIQEITGERGIFSIQEAEQTAGFVFWGSRFRNAMALYAALWSSQNLEILFPHRVNFCNVFHFELCIHQCLF